MLIAYDSYVLVALVLVTAYVTSSGYQIGFVADVLWRLLRRRSYEDDSGGAFIARRMFVFLATSAFCIHGYNSNVAFFVLGSAADEDDSRDNLGADTSASEDLSHCQQSYPFEDAKTYTKANGPIATEVRWRDALATVAERHVKNFCFPVIWCPCVDVSFCN